MTDRETVLRSRSIRTLAWLGDAFFEDEVRTRVALRGDFPLDRLDAIKAAVVRAESQAALLAALEPGLDDDELAVARRARNAALPGGARGRRATKDYRSATALEALIAHWRLAGDSGRIRLDALLAGPLDAAIERAVAAHGRRVRRG